MKAFKNFSIRVLLVLLLAPASLHAQTVTYSLGTESDLLDAAFYAGESADGSDVSGRGVLNVGVNNAGSEALVWGINMATEQQGLFSVDIGSPSSWRRVTPDEPFFYDRIVWAPNDRFAYVGIDMIYDASTESITYGASIGGSEFYVTSVGVSGGEFWAIGAQYAGPGGIPTYPILANGDYDSNRNLLWLTNFSFGPNDQLIFSDFGPDGDSIAFTIEDHSVSPTVGNTYRLTGVAAILADPGLAPTSVSDPRINEVRASTTTNYVTVPSFSADGSLVFTAEDYSGTFSSSDILANLPTSDFDINISSVDGSQLTRIQRPGGQGAVIPFTSGGRITYVSNTFEVVVSTLEVASDLNAETDPLPEGGTTAVIGGSPTSLPFTLTDSAVQATQDVTIADSSGTIIELPADQVINFPDGTANPEITIFTPVDPVAFIELPSPTTQIPVIRTFGPSGTQFYPPISITISYTQAEIRGIADETQMIPYLFNTATQQFEQLDAPFLATVVVDPDANTLTFQTDHFSTYGIGFTAVVTPQRPWAVYGLALVLAMLALVRLRPRRSLSERVER